MEAQEKTPEQKLKEARDELAFAQRRVAEAEEKIRAIHNATLDAMKPEFRRLAAEFGKARVALRKYWVEVRRTCGHGGTLVETEDKIYCTRCTLGQSPFEWPAAALGDESNVAAEDEANGLTRVDATGTP